MYNQNDPRVLWVSPEISEGEGTWENPYGSISEALSIVNPGNIIVLKKGTYKEDLTIEVSGKADLPIKIVSDTDAEVIIENACWFLYDTSDIIISSLIFKNAPNGAISVVGSCKRNRFDSLQFINCGTSGKASCTMYFGGSGGEFNVVENCLFHRDKPLPDGHKSSRNSLIALMVSEGDAEESNPIKNHILRRNNFTNYDFAILVGTQDSTTNSYGHVVEFNTIRNCLSDGIVVKCGDTRVKANLLENINGCSISVLAGIGSAIEDNRIVKSDTGIIIQGSGHNILNNCIIRCKEAIAICGKSEKAPASNLLVEKNTIIGYDVPVDLQSAFIRIEPGTSSIIQQNLLHGNGIPYCIIEDKGDCHDEHCQSHKIKTYSVINDNVCSGNCKTMDGISASQIVFSQKDSDCFINDSGYGASGWMLRPEGFDKNADTTDNDKDYIEASIMEDDDGNLIIPGENFEDNLLNRYYPEMLDLQNFSSEEFES